MYLTPAFSPTARTNVCSFCGNGPGKSNPLDHKSQDRPVVSTDLDIDWEGTVEFCLDCAAEAGALADMVPEKVAQELRTEAALARSENIALTSERDAARKALDALREDLANRPAKTPAKKAGQRSAAA